MSIQRAQQDINILRGDTYTFRYQLIDVNEETGVETPVNITDHKINGQVRYSPDSSDVWYTFPITKPDAAKGVFQWTLNKADSENLLPVGSFEPDTAFYDIQIEINNAVFTFMHGNFKVSRDITRV
ncbi:hypothetical protein [Vibrio vulnificus]|uniref:hypothetical protein n=1 Tax=Vibrio vulnificus TaxID=672 RepID=UPI00324214A7